MFENIGKFWYNHLSPSEKEHWDKLFPCGDVSKMWLYWFNDGCRRYFGGNK